VNGGVESLQEKDIGTEMSFLDINKAMRDGHFGSNPKIWGDDQWNLLINYISQGMEFDEGTWDSLDYTPQIWTTLETKRGRAPPASRQHIGDLKKRAMTQDPYMEHMLAMPAFSCDALSTITESTRQGDGEDSDGSFEEVEGKMWYDALKTWGPATAAKTKAAGAKTAPNLSGSADKTRNSKKKAKVKAACAVVAAAAASSSKAPPKAPSSSSGAPVGPYDEQWSQEAASSGFWQ
jgi:hypothetical protein